MKASVSHYLHSGQVKHQEHVFLWTSNRHWPPGYRWGSFACKM